MSDDARVPVDPSAHQQLVSAREKLEDLYEIDFDCIRDELRCLLQKPADVVVPQCLFAELG
jgi:hypothetical protein